MISVLTSGDYGRETDGDEVLDLLEIPGTTVVNSITVVNEGDGSGFWRIAQEHGDTPWARLPCGPGEVGERRAALVLPTPGLSGAVLQVKRSLLGFQMTGLFAFAMK